MIDPGRWRETSAPLRHWTPRAAIYAVMAALVSFGIPNAYRMGPGGYTEVAQGRVVSVEEVPREELRVVGIEFVDREGSRRVSTDSDRSGKPVRIGDAMPVVYDPESGRAMPVGMGLRILRGFFIALSSALLLFALGLVARALLQLRERRWLLRHGRIEQGQAPRVEWREVPFYREMPKLWRLRASWFDEGIAGWREVRTLWHASHLEIPQLDGNPLEIHIDPRDPRRAWLPLSQPRRTGQGKPATGARGQPGAATGLANGG